jgi:hypothetical protein
MVDTAQHQKRAWGYIVFLAFDPFPFPDPNFTTGSFSRGQVIFEL